MADTPGDVSTPVILPIDGAIIDVLEAPGDKDWFKLTLVAGQTYHFAVDSLDGLFHFMDLRIYDASGVLLTPGPFPGDVITFTAPASGTYFIEMDGGSFDTYSYQLQASSNTALASGQTLQGAIDFAKDMDWFALQLTAGVTYRISLEGAGVTELGDAFFQLFNSAGTVVVSDNDSGEGTDALVYYTPNASGTYYLAAQGRLDTTGTYDVSLEAGVKQNPLKTIDWGTKADGNVISIYFGGTGETFGAFTGDRDWTVDEKASFLAACATYSAVCNLTFAETNDSGAATLKMVIDALGNGVLGATVPINFGPNGGTGALTAQKTYSAGAQVQGGEFFNTVVHEVGHALGLAHPHDSGGESEIMEGVVFLGGNSYSMGKYVLNESVFTVMSYNRGWPAGPVLHPTSDFYGFAGTPMPLDINVLQDKYGANLGHNTGATEYLLSDGNFDVGLTYRGIWDAGGTDTIAYDGGFNAVIDLRAATLQSEIGGGGYVSYAGVSPSGYTIANGVVIERGRGGSGADTITGNGAANRLDGNGGADTLDGGAGADSLFGGDGGDTYMVDNAGDLVVDSGIGGVDLVRSSVTFSMSSGIESLVLSGGANRNGVGNALANTITGNSGANYLTSKEGADTLNGGSGNDTLNGGADIDSMSGGLGDDFFYVNHGSDVVADSGGVDTVSSSITYTLGAAIENLILTGDAQRFGTGNGLNNTITGSNAANRLRGHNGDDKLHGNGGADTLEGGNGGDLLRGGEGLDTLTGGAGADIFVFNTKIGQAHIDTIADFNVADDTIHLDNAMFTALGAAGALAAGMLRLGAAAQDANDFLIYNPADGALYYDPNANVAGGAVRVATLSTGLTLTAADFLVI